MHDSPAIDVKQVCRHSCLTFLAVCFMPVAAAAAAANSCVDCHAVAASRPLRDSHADWEGSIHARLHVACEDCHAGNPREVDKGSAHQGVYGAMNPRSTVYYTKITGLCGQCHKREFLDFQSSSHYRSLISQGTGPDCIACHDAMATKVIGAAAIAKLCGVCHNPGNRNLPEVGALARDILSRMAGIDWKIAQVREKLKVAGRQGVNQNKASGFLNLASRELRDCKANWHTFQLQRMAARLDGVDSLVQKALDSLEDHKAGAQ